MFCRRCSSQEEALLQAIQQCKTSYRTLRLIHKEIGDSIDREAKQIERLQFAYESVKSSAAYFTTLETMMSAEE